MTDTEENQNIPSPGTPSDVKKTEQEIVREAKLKSLAESGVDIFPYKADVTHTVSGIVFKYSDSLKENLEKKEVKVKVAGR